MRMRFFLFLGALALASLGSWALRGAPTPPTTPVPALPFYGSADFTPSWEGTEHRVGGFSLVDQAGRAFEERDLEGRLSVVGTLFTACTSLCPRVAEGLEDADAALADVPGVQFVMHTVTPHRDSPEVLTAYARARGLAPGRWRLLTGPESAIRRCIQEEYLLGRPGDEVGLHTESVVLVDRERRIRGIYNATLPLEVQRLVEDVRSLRH